MLVAGASALKRQTDFLDAFPESWYEEAKNAKDDGLPDIPHFLDADEDLSQYFGDSLMATGRGNKNVLEVAAENGATIFVKAAKLVGLEDELSNTCKFSMQVHDSCCGQPGACAALRVSAHDSLTSGPMRNVSSCMEYDVMRQFTLLIKNQPNTPFFFRQHHGLRPHQPSFPPSGQAHLSVLPSLPHAPSSPHPVPHDQWIIPPGQAEGRPKLQHPFEELDGSI